MKLPTFWLVIAISLTATLLSCAEEESFDNEEPLSVVQQPSICGSSTDWQEVELYDGTLGTTIDFVASHEQPVGRISWESDLASRYNNPGSKSGKAQCSGTLIADNIFITAGHCFDRRSSWPRNNSDGSIISSAQGAQEMHVEFDFQLDGSGSPRTAESFAITQLLEYRLGGLDYAVVQLEGSPGETYGTAEISPFALESGDAITIIQHPSGLPKKVHAGTIDTISSSAVFYFTADTFYGSSGSGVLNNSSGYISAIHTTIGCNVSSSSSNEGVTVSSIYEFSEIVRGESIDAAKVVSIY